jgi:nucleoside-diphosphate-sugar epimerase
VLLQGDVREKAVFSEKPDYIIHCAAVTKSKEMVDHPVENLLTSVEGTQNALGLALQSNIKSMVYISSMEVYGTNAQDGRNHEAAGLVTEDMLGYLDLSDSRSVYPEGKRAAECLCRAYCREYGVPVKTARLAQTFGAGVPMEENRVFAQFARSAMQGKDIVLHTDGSSEGNYCYLADAICGILTILLQGRDGEAYNVANEALHGTILQMAELVADEIAERKIKIVFDIPKDVSEYGYAAHAKLRLSSEKLRALGWTAEFDMKDMYRRMMAFWKEQAI